MTLPVWLWLLVGCARPVPAGAIAAPAAPAEPTEPAARLEWMLAGDPLARHPRTPVQPVEDPALAAFVAESRREDAPPGTWFALERAHPGTVAVPLARGARLYAQEVAGDEPEAILSALFPLELPLASGGLVRGPLDWSGAVSPRDLLAIGERAVLLGWLAGPEVPRAAARALLGGDDWARLADTPAGRLLRAADGPRLGGAGPGILRDATRYALLRAAADRPADQAEVQTEKTRLAEQFGVGGDPLATMLRRAREELTSAGDTGLGLVALTAERLGRTCPDRPCTGFDRVASLALAARWSPEAQMAADAWTIIALKDARDHLEVAYDEPSFPAALDAVLDVLLGLGASGLDRSLLRQGRPGPAVHLAICRALGAGDQTSKDSVFAALDARLVSLVEAALQSLDRVPGHEGWRAPLARIARRAEAPALPEPR